MKEELLRRNYEILNYRTVDEQIPIWVEELSELTKELCKRQRKRCFNDEMYENTKLEITDVQVCLDQMKEALNYNLTEQEKNYSYKVERTLDILHNSH